MPTLPGAPKLLSDREGRGFTLIELLVVIVIIGALASIAIPTYLGQRDKAVEASEKSDARSIATQLETYYIDAQQYPTPGELTWSAGSRTVQVGSSGEIVRLSPNNRARVLSGDDGQGFCVEVVNSVTSTTAVYTSGEGGLQSVGAGATCPARYDQTVLEIPPS